MASGEAGGRGEPTTNLHHPGGQTVSVAGVEWKTRAMAWRGVAGSWDVEEATVAWDVKGASRPTRESRSAWRIDVVARPFTCGSTPGRLTPFLGSSRIAFHPRATSDPIHRSRSFVQRLERRDQLPLSTAMDPSPVLSPPPSLEVKPRVNTIPWIRSPTCGSERPRKEEPRVARCKRFARTRRRVDEAEGSERGT